MEFIDFARACDAKFILEGIIDICIVEKQKPESRNKLLKQVKKALRNKEIRAAYVNNEIIGFIQFKFTNKNPYGIDYGNYERRFCWIEWLYVTKKWQGKGIGKSLSNDVIKLCKKSRITELMLDVFNVNTKAEEFYKKEGFTEFIKIMRKKI